MHGRSRVLPVPFFTQPTAITCQSTVLRMFATYLERAVVFQSTGAAARDILSIWKDINESRGRPARERNAHANLKWWLEHHFPTLRFQYLVSRDEVTAIESIIRFVDCGFPVMMSVSHVHTLGHILLVVGYEGYVPNASSPDFRLVVHDPYGRFDPSLRSRLFGKRRWVGGMSLAAGGETGPGENVRIPLAGVSRQRTGDARLGTYYLLSASR